MSEPNELTPHEELLPCPMCGGFAYAQDQFRAVCSQCATSGPIPCWNRRAYLAATALPVDPDALTGCADDQKYSRAEVDAMREVLNPTALPPEMEERTPNTPEPLPNRVDGPAAWDLVITDMRERDTIGTAKYGQRLTVGDGRKSIVDAYQEVLDLAVYLRKEISERERLLATIRMLQGQLAEQNTVSFGLRRYLDNARAELSRLRADLEAATTRITDRQIVIDQHNETIAGLEAAMVVRWERIGALEAENAGLRKALAWYADSPPPHTYYIVEAKDRTFLSDVSTWGDKARAALNAGEAGG